ncbi:GNAT family N-acetyltransferase [Parvularcula dongshanensis]|uniref:GNAT superfamily N-acetyltransferase n=1 Tax=Parvularcula dongshanensis TaxID=1173995 RepID=A0A840I651_9PROT|nr:GNAT family N-acetyltransferase [Parvularcula dongshanensis]MBB4659664.1 GNAT superfamily N-acetyltransferase [Parvularcula dongshanensis]
MNAERALTVRTLRGGEVEPALPAIAALRIEVFRDYPYLYDGDEAYERRYLEGFAQAKDAVAVVVEDEGRVVGCATASAITDRDEAFAAPIAPLFDLAAVYYLGESVLLPAYRGRGIGHAFFDGREAAAREGGYARACFCAVERPERHSFKPAGYRPLDGFWRARGYERLDGVRTAFAWREVGQHEETEKPMAYWTKALEPEA